MFSKPQSYISFFFLERGQFIMMEKDLAFISTFANSEARNSTKKPA